MFTLSLIYVVLYLFLFLAVLILTFSQLPLYFLTHMSMSSFMIFFQKYKHTKNLYLWLFFCLTGLPPVGLFFVKFNIFFYVLYQSHLFVIIVLFLLFFLNMLYYAQVFNFRNFKKSMYTVITPKMFTVWNSNEFFGKFMSTYNTYYLTLAIINIIMLLVLTALFFTDYFLILNIL